jgi:hypothetical protein
MAMPWFLLYDGSHEDVREYAGRTLNTAAARSHLHRLQANPRSTGSVLVITDRFVRHVRSVGALVEALDEHARS